MMGQSLLHSGRISLPKRIELMPATLGNLDRGAIEQRPRRVKIRLSIGNASSQGLCNS